MVASVRPERTHSNGSDPVANVQERALVRAVVQKHHAVRSPEIRLRQTSKPAPAILYIECTVQYRIHIRSQSARAERRAAAEQWAHRSWPAVSQICIVTILPSTSSVRLWKSTPSVEPKLAMKRPRHRRNANDDLPTATSPTFERTWA